MQARRAFALGFAAASLLAGPLRAGEDGRHLDFQASSLGKFSADLNQSGGQWQCNIVASSGYADLDAKACANMIDCVNAMRDRFFGSAGTQWVRRDPQGYQKEFAATFGGCVRTGREPLIAEYRLRKQAEK